MRVESHRQGRGDQSLGSWTCREVQLRSSQLEGRRPQIPAGRSTGARPDSESAARGYRHQAGVGDCGTVDNREVLSNPRPAPRNPGPCAARAAPPGLAARRAHLGSAPPRRRQREGTQAAMCSGGSRLRGPDPAAPPRSAPPRRRRSGCEGRGALRPFRSGSLQLRCHRRRRRCRGAQPDGSSDQPIRARRVWQAGPIATWGRVEAGQFGRGCRVDVGGARGGRWGLECRMAPSRLLPGLAGCLL